MDPKEIINLILHHLNGVWRFRWVAVAVAWLVMICATIYVFAMTDKYQASTKVYVDTENVLRPLLRGLYVETDVMNDVALMSRALLSRPHLEDVIRKLDLDLAVTNATEQESLVRRLEQSISISTPRRENIYTISVINQDRDVALGIVKALLDTFVEDTMGNSMKDSESAESTLKLQLDTYERRLLEAEDRLSQFKKENVGLMPGETGGYYAQLEQTLRARNLLARQLAVAEETLVTIKRQIDGVDPVFSGNAGSSFDAQIQAMEATLNQLLLEFTDVHPEVLRTRERLEVLYERRRTELADPGASNLNAPELQTNPVIQNMQIQLSEAGVTVATLNAQIRDHDKEIARLRGLVGVIPEVEAQLTRLNRDYNVVQERYQDMLMRWESLQTGKAVSSGRDQVTFRVIEPPFASLSPVSPNRDVFLILGLASSLGCGLALAFLLHLLRPVFSSVQELGGLGFPVIGQMSFVDSNSASSVMPYQTTALVFCAAALFVAAVLSIVMSEQGAALVRTLLGGLA